MEHAFVTMLLALYPAVASVAVEVAAFYAGGLPARIPLRRASSQTQPHPLSRRKEGAAGTSVAARTNSS